MARKPTLSLDHLYEKEILSWIDMFKERDSNAFSLEECVPFTEKDLNKFRKETLKDPILYETLTTPIKDTSYKYLVDFDELLREAENELGPEKIAKTDFIENLSLDDIMYTTARSRNLFPYFIIDKKGKKIGFIAYGINKNDPTCVSTIKLFRFDESMNDTLLEDVPRFIDDLLVKFHIISWAAFIENPAIKAYHVYMLKKKREHYVCSERTRGRHVFYTIVNPNYVEGK
jgi:hypothetical protein